MVAVVLERCPAVLPCLLEGPRADAAYLPISPALPPECIDFARGRPFDAGPGDSVYFPATNPHMTSTVRGWEVPGDGVSISIGVVFTLRPLAATRRCSSGTGCCGGSGLRLRRCASRAGEMRGKGRSDGRQPCSAGASGATSRPPGIVVVSRAH
jgi:hypothetical protein